MSPTATKIPPQDQDAELAVLGALLLDKEAIIKIADIISPGDFYVPANQKVYETILELYENSEPIDLVTVTNKLKDKKTIKDVGGMSYLSDVVESVPTAAHVEHYARIVREKRIRRELIRASSEINEKAFGQENFEDLIDQVERRIFGISQTSHAGQKFIHVKDELSRAYERLETLHQMEGNTLRGVPTGFRGLDYLLSGLQRSDLILLGARPSFGKTSLALDIARHAATQGHAVGIFSIEMSREQILDRLIAAQAQVPLWRLRTGRLNEDIEFAMVRNALDELSKLHLFIDDTPSPSIIQMRSMARRLQMEQKLDLLVIDYLQLIQPRTGSDNMVTQVTEISRGLKSLARELNIPILALSQLSRAVDKREGDKTPRLSDLRESGSLEQDSDVVMFLARKDRDSFGSDKYENLSDEDQNLVRIVIAKHRNGPVGVVKLKFDPEKASFRDIDTQHSPLDE